MKTMRYLNLFSQICKVPTKYCFNYNNSIIFIVPLSKVTRAIGSGARNVKLLCSKIGRKVRVLGLPNEINSATVSKFVSSLVEPITFTKLELRNKTIMITGGRQARASLIGRNRIREEELLKLLKGVFGIEGLKFN